MSFAETLDARTSVIDDVKQRRQKLQVQKNHMSKSQMEIMNMNRSFVMRATQRSSSLYLGQDCQYEQSDDSNKGTLLREITNIDKMTLHEIFVLGLETHSSPLYDYSADGSLSPSTCSSAELGLASWATDFSQ